jgi:DNA-binding transcriptional MocR family regulator
MAERAAPSIPSWAHPALRLNPQSPVPLWAQVARELRRRIVEWELPAGSPLPPEQFLADQYGLSFSTAQQAYRAMQEAGQVESGPRDGYHVTRAVPMEYVPVPPGSKITAPAAGPDVHPDIPWWLVIALKVEAPGMEPVWYDATRTTLMVS